MARLQAPLPYFYDTSGAPLDAGFIYIGEANQDPQTHPIDLYADEGRITPLAQPLRTLGGLVVDDRNPTFVYMEEDDYSIRVADANDATVFHLPSIAQLTVTYQPHDTTLDDLSGAPTTAYGIALLNLANQAALVAALGLPAYLALTGGTVSGAILRASAGAHVYHTDPANTSGRIFITAAGAADPTSLPGEIWLESE